MTSSLAFARDSAPFIPEELHAPARTFFAEAGRSQSGPEYYCPFLDPSWSDDQIQTAMNESALPLESGELDPDNCPYQVVVRGLCPNCGHFHGQACPICGGLHGPM
jgi:hypothetical protein